MRIKTNRYMLGEAVNSLCLELGIIALGGVENRREQILDWIGVKLA